MGLRVPPPPSSWWPSIKEAQEAQDLIAAFLERTGMHMSSAGLRVLQQLESRDRPQPVDACAQARCAYCARYGPLGQCQGCGAPNEPVKQAMIAPSLALRTGVLTPQEARSLLNLSDPRKTLNTEQR
jgi:hypothetical protein